MFIWAWVILLYTQLDLSPSSHDIWTSQWTRPGRLGSHRTADLFAISPLNNKPIKQVCRQTVWNENLIFTCNESYEGIRNIRNPILHCIPYAMHAGASLVLPRIVLRSAYAIQDIETGETADFSYMFHTQHFLDSVRLSCPEMNIHLSIDDVVNMTWAEESDDDMVLSLKPESLVQGDIPRTGPPELGAWRGQFHSCLESQAVVLSSPIVVNLQRSYMMYPIYSDGEAIALAFASLLQFRNDTRVLATKVLEALGGRILTARQPELGHPSQRLLRSTPPHRSRFPIRLGERRRLLVLLTLPEPGRRLPAAGPPLQPGRHLRSLRRPRRGGPVRARRGKGTGAAQLHRGDQVRPPGRGGPRGPAGADVRPAGPHGLPGPAAGVRLRGGGALELCVERRAEEAPAREEDGVPGRAGDVG